MPVHPYIHVLKANLLGLETSCSTNDLVFFILVCLFSLFICSKIHTFTSLAGPVFANHTVELSQLHLLVNVLSRNSDTIWHWHNSIQSNRRSFPLTAFPLYTTYYSMFVFLLSTCLVIDKYIYIHFFFCEKRIMLYVVLHIHRHLSLCYSYARGNCDNFAFNDAYIWDNALRYNLFGAKIELSKCRLPKFASVNRQKSHLFCSWGQTS